MSVSSSDTNALVFRSEHELLYEVRELCHFEQQPFEIARLNAARFWCNAALSLMGMDFRLPTPGLPPFGAAALLVRAVSALLFFRASHVPRRTTLQRFTCRH